jgi:predicted HNH restriction endonuclease
MTKSKVTEELKDFISRTIKAYPSQEASTEDLNSEVEKVNIRGLDKTDPESWKNTVRHALISLRRKKIIGSFAKNLDKVTMEEEKRISDWLDKYRPNQSREQQIWYLEGDYREFHDNEINLDQEKKNLDNGSEASSHILYQEDILYTAFPDEISPEGYHEGSVRKILVNAYERDPKARQKCIDYYGLSCKICSFSFEEEFGDLGRGFINVHHLKPLSEIGQEYKVDPIRDLLPVCPNCHAMFHRKEPALSVEEVKAARIRTDSLKDDQ